MKNKKMTKLLAAWILTAAMLAQPVSASEGPAANDTAIESLELDATAAENTEPPAAEPGSSPDARTAAEPTAEDPATEDPTTQDPAAEAPAAEDPATQDPTTQDPATEDPTAQDPATEDSPTEDPATQDPAAEAPAAQDPATEDSPTEAPAAEDPSVQDPGTQAPATEDPTTEDPATQDPATQDPAAKEPAAEDPATQDPATQDPAAEDPATDAPEEEIALDTAATGITKYTYKARPLLAPFPNYIYVETNNPNPDSFCLVDKDTCYGDGNVCIYKARKRVFADVAYENERTYRVKGGYIFYCETTMSDGGELILSTPDGYSYVETEKKITISPMKDYVDYLIDTYGGTGSFFEKLDAIQSGLNKIAVYPKTLCDQNSPNPDRPYPLYALSLYPENLPNDHYDMFNKYEAGYLLYHAYPFVLDSVGFPGTMNACAERLDPNVVISSGGAHYLTRIKLGGTSKTYGGDGAGTAGPLFMNRLSDYFLFDNSAGDFALRGTIKTYYDKHRELERYSQTDIAPYKAVLEGEEFKQSVGTGSWAKVAVEGWLGYGTGYAYLYPNEFGNLKFASKAWVDGRYVGENEGMFLGEVAFAEHPNDDIIVTDMSYTDIDGNEHTQDVLFKFDPFNDQWEASAYYDAPPSERYDKYDGLPDEFILTREEAAAMELDRNAGILPPEGIVCDGTVKPGTLFPDPMITGISFTEDMVVIGTHKTEDISDLIRIESVDGSTTPIRLKSSNHTIASVTYNQRISGEKVGEAVITVSTEDGRFQADITVKVVDYEKPAVEIKAIPEGIKISWNAVPGAKHYLLERTCYDYYGNMEKSVPVVMDGTSYVDRDVTGGNDYYYNVTCVSDRGNPLSETGSGRIYYEPVIPEQMPALTLANTPTGVKITWEWERKADGYLLYRAKDGGASECIAKIEDNYIESYADSTANVSGSRYSYQIAAYCIVDGKEYSNSSSPAADIYYVPKMRLTKASNYSSGIKVSWKKVPGAQYLLYRRIGKGSWERIATLDSTSYKDTGARTNGTTYSYRVRARLYANGKKYTGPYSDVLKSVYLKKQSVTSLKSAKKGQLAIGWKKNTAAGGYEVQCARKESFKDAKTVVISKPTLVTKTVKGLKSGKKYYVRVRSYKVVKGVKYCSAWSGVKSLKVR